MPKLKIIHIGPFDYKVKWKQKDTEKTSFEYGSRLLGRCMPTRQTIVVSPNQTTMMQRDTLIHESLHAVISNSGLQMDQDIEEQLVRTLTGQLLDLFRSNPKLMEFLLDD